MHPSMVNRNGPGIEFVAELVQLTDQVSASHPSVANGWGDGGRRAHFRLLDADPPPGPRLPSLAPEIPRDGPPGHGYQNGAP
ncbi:hypothetical protein ACU686_42965 [Yinghuangia aomiensis]